MGSICCEFFIEVVDGDQDQHQVHTFRNYLAAIVFVGIVSFSYRLEMNEVEKTQE